MEALNKVKAAIGPRVTWLQESWAEVRHKVTWPSKQEVWGTTRVVLFAVLVFAIAVGSMDYVMSLFMDSMLALFA